MNGSLLLLLFQNGVNAQTATGSGTVDLGGCARVKVNKYYYYKFSEGSVVYFVPKAMRGILEPHAVKEVIMKPINGNPQAAIFLYIDSYNAYFNEDELCSQSDAIQYAKNFYINRIAELKSELQIQDCAFKS